MTTPESGEVAGQQIGRVASPASAPPGARARRPLAVLVALLAVLVVAYGSAVVLDRRFRPPVGAVPDAASPVQGANLASGTRFAQTPEEREVEQAVWRFLQVYQEALLTLDKRRLEEVLDGPALQLVSREVDELKAGGWPVKVIEDERVLTFAGTTSTTAKVEDRYISRTVYIDPQSKQPAPRQDPPVRVLQVYELKKANGVWKVVGGTRDVVGRAG